MFEVTQMHVFGLSALIFVVGLVGILRSKQSFLFFLMSIEVLLLAIVINLVAIGTFNNNVDASVMALLVLAVAAAEASIGLAILMLFFKQKDSVNMDAMKDIKEHDK